ncbi:hypothetical protein OKW50_002213 [Paraburkholderia youngii]
MALCVADAVAREYDAVGLVIQRHVRMRERAGHVAVSGDRTREAEAEPIELRRVDGEAQPVAGRAEAALQIDLIARYGKIRAARQDSRAGQLDHAAARQRQIVVDARAEREFGARREDRREHTGRGDRGGYARLDPARGCGRARGRAPGCAMRGRRRPALEHLGLHRRLSGVLRDGRGLITGRRALRASGAARERRGLRLPLAPRAARGGRAGTRDGRARRHLRGQRQRIEIGQLRLQVVGRVRIVLQRAR